MINKRIVRYTTLDGDPVVIGTKGKNSADSSENLSEDEENARRLLTDALLKEKRAAEKLKDAELQAEILKKQAQDERDQLIADTKAKADADAKRVTDEAYKKGYDDGFKKGHAEGVKKGRTDGKDAVKKESADIIKQANAKAQKTLQDAKEQTANYFIDAEDDIAEVVMKSIEKILPQIFIDMPQAVLPVVREAIKYVRDQKEIIVHVEPESYDLILMARGDFQSMLTDGTAVLEVVSDDALKPGDCVIETPNGGIDARLATQIELMKNSIQAVLNK